MKIARIGLFLFSLPFAAFGIGFFIFMVYPDVSDWLDSRSWQPVSATLLSAKLETHHSSKSSTYEAMATYHYQFNGQEYTGKRVSLSHGADNIGSFQQTLGHQLERLYRTQQPLQIWVNPDRPQQALINRDLRWGLLSLKMIFVVAFAGIGLALMYSAFRSKPASASSSPVYNSGDTKPWLNHKQWSSPVIRSSAKKTLWVMWLFALVWNGLTMPVATQIPGELQKGEWGVLFILIFNVIGVVILIMAVRKTLEWRRFGVTLLTMDPHPGAIGGHVGGTIDVKLPYHPGRKFKIVLSNIHSYVSGTGKNRSRHEKVIWQDVVEVEGTYGMQGSRIPFCFEVPDKLRASEQYSNSYYKWTVAVSADLPGVDLDRDFEIPVFPTKQHSTLNVQHHQQSSVLADSHVTDNDSPLQIRQHSASGKTELYYPPGRAKGMAMVLALTGSAFMAVAVFFAFKYWSGHGSIATFLIFGGVFFMVGLLMDCGAIYTLTNSLQVFVDSDGIKAIRKIAGIALFQRNVASHDVHEIKIERGAQSGNTVYYSIFAYTRQRRRIKIGESFIGASSAEKIADLVKRELRL